MLKTVLVTVIIHDCWETGGWGRCVRAGAGGREGSPPSHSGKAAGESEA